MTIDIEMMMLHIYDSEINIEITSLWDTGYTFKLNIPHQPEYHTYDFKDGVVWLNKTITEWKWKLNKDEKGKVGPLDSASEKIKYSPVTLP